MTQINVDTARANLRAAALRHCPRADEINTGIATGLDLDAAALAYAAAMRRESSWAKIAPFFPGMLAGNIATLIATGNGPPLWLIAVAVAVATIALVGMIARKM